MALHKRWRAYQLRAGRVGRMARSKSYLTIERATATNGPRTVGVSMIRRSAGLTTAAAARPSTTV